MVNQEVSATKPAIIKVVLRELSDTCMDKAMISFQKGSVSLTAKNIKIFGQSLSTENQFSPLTTSGYEQIRLFNYTSANCQEKDCYFLKTVA